MQLSAISLALTRAGFSAFTPKKLFTSGAQGAWYDPSDYSTMFEDAAGTIPITTPLEKPVGLMLDKSRGLVLGPELVTNGTFDTNINGWALSSGSGGSISWASGKLRLVRSGSTSANQGVSVTSGKTYKFTATASLVSGSTVSSLSIRDGSAISSTTLAFANIPSGASASVYYLATSTTTVYVHLVGATADGTVDFDNISVKELPGNHAYQSTTTSRPTLSARYNLLTKTEDFSDAAWTKGSSGDTWQGTGVQPTITANYGVAPDGTMTADRIQLNCGAGTTLADRSGIAIINITTVATNYTSTIYVKPLDSTTDQQLLDSNVGLLAAGNTHTSIISDVGNGWKKIVRTETGVLAQSTSAFRIQIIGNVSPQTMDLLVWGADLRVANDGVNLPSYQRVNTATDYDYAGFPPYLKFDGTDDGMATNSIDFSATDKMFVAAGVRKLSDAAAGTIVETGDTNVTTGVFSCAASGTNGTDRQSWACSFSGSSLFVVRQPRTYVSPITNVLSYQMNSAASTNATQIIPRVNGLTPSIIYDAAGPAASGSFANKALYIGIRAGSIFPLNGRLYSLIVIGKAASAAEIASTEAYLNAKTKAY